MLILFSRSHCKICPLPSMTISCVFIVSNCWEWANFTQGPNEKNQHFIGLETKSMFIYTRVSAPKRFAKFGRLFLGKKEEKAVSQLKSDRLLQAMCIPLGCSLEA